MAMRRAEKRPLSPDRSERVPAGSQKEHSSAGSQKSQERTPIKRTTIQKWREQFPWIIIGAPPGSHRPTVLGCRSCQAANIDSIFARCQVPIATAQWSVFQNHERSRRHRDSLKPTNMATHAAPSAETFHEVLRKARDGQTPTNIPGVACSKKIRNIKYCLAEAIRLFNMEILRKAVVVALHCDGRKGRLAVRFTSCGKDLTPCSGVLGTASLVEQFSTDAIGISRALQSIIDSACTTFQAVPNKASPPERELDENIRDHLRTAVELFNADAAADEQLAGRLLAGLRKCADDSGPYFPNIKVLNKDKAHAARRITSRTWMRDVYLKQVAMGFAIGKHSITKRIHHSDVFRSRFAKNTRICGNDVTAASQIKSLASANHRFDSHAKPFARGVIFWRALLKTAMQLQDERSAKPEGQDASAWIASVDEQSAVTFAMLADSGAETLNLVRFFDQEAVDHVSMATQLKHFLERVEWLFTHRGCLTVGYTHLMLRQLSKSCTLFHRGKGGVNTARTLGGPRAVTPAILDACFNRMSNWIRLAKMVIMAEFPSFDAIAAFSVFDVPAASQTTMAQSSQPGICTKLETLAKLSGVSSTDLVEQFDDFPRGLGACKGGEGIGGSVALCHHCLLKSEKLAIEAPNMCAQASAHPDDGIRLQHIRRRATLLQGPRGAWQQKRVVSSGGHAGRVRASCARDRSQA